MLGVPMERTIHHTCFWHFMQIARGGWEIPPFVYGRTDLNRNLMAQTLLESDCTHIVMLDADHIHRPDIVERLARWVLDDPARLVVGGLNFRRTQPYDPCIFFYDDNGKLRSPMEWPEGLIEVDAIGHGCILIAREVFERLPVPYWAYAYNHAENGIYPSEDMLFSQSCRQNNVAMWCDTTTTSPHMSPFYVDADIFRQFIEANKDKVQLLGKRNGQEKRPRKPKPKREKVTP